VSEWGALIGYIGTTAPPADGNYTSTAILPQALRIFYVGASYEAQAAESGTLWLNKNADAYSVSLFGAVGDPAIDCAEAGFWLSGQLGGDLGRWLRKISVVRAADKNGTEIATALAGIYTVQPAPDPPCRNRGLVVEEIYGSRLWIALQVNIEWLRSRRSCYRGQALTIRPAFRLLLGRENPARPVIPLGLVSSRRRVLFPALRPSRRRR